MSFDTRGDVARFYDLAPHHPTDLPFCRERVEEGRGSVLELGCGTGRITVPLAAVADRLRRALRRG